MSSLETAPSNLIRPGVFGQVEAGAERFISAARCITGLPFRHPFPWIDEARRAAALEALARQAPSESFMLRLRWLGNDEPLRVLVGQRIKITSEDGDTKVLCQDLDRRLDSWLALLWPEVQLAKLGVSLPSLPVHSAVRPLAARLPKDAKLGPKILSVRQAPPAIIEHPERRTFDVVSALAVLAPYAPSELGLCLSPIALDALAIRAIQDTEQRLLAAVLASTRRDDVASSLAAFFSLLRERSAGIRISVRLRSTQTLDRAVLDLVSLALFGSPADHESRPTDSLDLRGFIPLGVPLPRLLPSQSELRAIELRFTHASTSEQSPAAGSVTLGSTVFGEHICLSPRDRARHLYVLGATGTGKSTALLNLIQQDLDAGEGVILIDPHGDLADAARCLIPPHRRDECIWSDLSDPSTAIGLNILEGQGGDPMIERNYVCNELISLFKRVLYRGVPEAFGPMFEVYFRNALMLLMDGGGPDATLMDFERVFHDDKYRDSLLCRCTDRKIVEFWRGIAEKVTWNEISLENVAPYIVCKLAQITGNPLVRRMIEGRRSTLDLRGIMDGGGVAFIKLAKGLVGGYDATLLATLLTIRIAQAGMARANLSPDLRRPVRVYIDEFQNCAGGSLSDMLAEARKYGVSLTLANQSLTQVDGQGDHNNAGPAVLANAANLVVFRVGAQDARALASWFDPDISWQELCRLPDFYAATRVLDNGRPMPSRVMRLPPPPN